MISTCMGVCLASSRTAKREHLQGCGFKLLNAFDWFIPIALIVIGILGSVGVIPCPALVNGFLLGGGIIPFLYNILLTLAECKKKETISASEPD